MSRYQDSERYPIDYSYEERDGNQEDGVDYIDYSHTGFEEEPSDYSDELDDAHRFHVAMNVFDLISVLVGLAVILLLVAILVSLITWLQRDITQSLTLFTSNLQ